MSVGKLIVISGPSGVGKTSLIKRLLEVCEAPLELSVSATTRPQRQGEEEGVDYHFLTAEEFNRRREAGHFLECCEVFGRGHWYGTLKQDVETGLRQGKALILEIDVQGAQKVMAQYPQAVTIFIGPESIEQLEERLRGRATESEETISKRLGRAQVEMDLAAHYRHYVVNQSFDVAVREMCEIIKNSGA